MSIGIDVASVRDETEAMVLMHHHLRLAAAYFEATPEQFPHSFASDDFSKPAIEAWLAAMEALYPKED